MATRSHDSQEQGAHSGSTTDSEFVLSDKHWELIEDLFPWEPPGEEGGRPRVQPRQCLEGILWVLRTGARWKDLPKYFPSKSTCHLWFSRWTKAGIIEEVYRRLLLKLNDKGKVNCSETFADGTFSSAKKGVNRSDRLVAVKEPRSCSLSTAEDFHSRSTRNRPMSMRSSWLKDWSNGPRFRSECRND